MILPSTLLALRGKHDYKEIGPDIKQFFIVVIGQMLENNLCHLVTLLVNDVSYSGTCDQMARMFVKYLKH